MTTSYTTLPTAGVDTKRPSSRAEFKLGTVVLGDENGLWTFGVASGAVGAGVCTLNTTTFAITSAAGNHTAPVALTDGQYAWVYKTAGAN